MKMVRWAVLCVGIVAVIVGVAGLFTPITVGDREVGCGSAVFKDLTAARMATDLGGQNIPFPDTRGIDPDYPTENEANEAIANADYVRLCEKELHDRRVWTIWLAAAGALAVAAAVLLGARAGRNARQS